MRSLSAFALAALLAGTALRLVTLPLLGTSDLEAFKAWSFHATSVGVTHAYGDERPTRRHTFIFDGTPASANYPPLTIGVLAVIGHFYRGAMGGAFPNAPALTVALKSVILGIDVVLAAVVWFAVRRVGGSRAAWWGAAAFWANPAAILMSSLGYIDVWFAAPAVASLVCASFGWPIGAGVLLAVAALTKQQAIFIAPVVALALWNGGDPRVASGVAAQAPRARTLDGRTRIVTASVAGALVTIVFLTPIVVAGTTPNMLRAVGSVAFQTMLSGNACNLWWVVGYGFQVVDAVREGVTLSTALQMPADIVLIPQLPSFGPLHVRVIAILLTVSTAAWGLWIGRQARDLAVLAGVGAFLVHAYFVCSTQVHENHFFLAIPLLAIAAALRRDYIPVLTALSVIFALNLYLFYGFEGDAAPKVLRTATVVDSTVLLAIANAAALVWHARVLKRAASAVASVRE